MYLLLSVASIYDLLLQKRAIRSINQSNYIEPTNILFINLNTLKFYDLVENKMTQIMYKAQTKMLCCSTQKLFEVRESQFDLRGTDFFSETLGCFAWMIVVKFKLMMMI